VARYDRVIPPGGQGKVTLTIDTSRVRGPFEKKAIVWSNDKERMSVALYLRGEVKPHIAMEPGGYVALGGIVGKVPLEQIEIINLHEEPVKIEAVENDLPERVEWRIKEIRPGYVYRLEVMDISKERGDYTGHLIIKTDYPPKPELIVIVNGNVRKE
jgi:hypothetical protein